MSDSLNEQVSACVDGESDVTEIALLLRRLSQDDALRTRWARYHLISDTLKGNLPDQPSVAFAERVHQAVLQEATPRRHFGVARLLKPAAGFAIAASVAALAVVAVRSLPPGPDHAPAEQLASVTAPQAAAEIASLPRDQGTRWDRAQPEVAARLNTYMLNHSGHADTAGMQAVIPYVRIVGYDVGE